MPVARPKRLKEGFSTDTLYSSTRSARGFICAQVFLGIESGYTIIIPLKSKAYYITRLHPIHWRPTFPHVCCCQGRESRGVGKHMSKVLHTATFI